MKNRLYCQICENTHWSKPKHMSMKIDFPTGVIFLFGNRLYLKKDLFIAFYGEYCIFIS